MPTAANNGSSTVPRVLVVTRNVVNPPESSAQEFFTVVRLDQNMLIVQSPYMFDIGERLLVQIETGVETTRKHAEVTSAIVSDQSCLIEFDLTVATAGEESK